MDIEEMRAIVNGPDKQNRRKPDHEESRIQQDCVEWFHLQYPKLVIFAIPNGGKRGGKMVRGKGGKMVPLEAAIMKREGVLAGVGDLFLMYAAKGLHGLFIEMKTEDGSQTETQKEFETLCDLFGYGYVVCRNLEEFMDAINDYIN